MKPVYVYVAGPLSVGNVVENIRKAVWACDYLLSIGYTPFCPHLTHFWAAITGDKSWDTWLEFDEKWLLKCDVVFRLSGESPGADREVAFARQYGIPTVYTVEALEGFFPLKSTNSELHNNRFGQAPCPNF